LKKETTTIQITWTGEHIYCPVASPKDFLIETQGTIWLQNELAGRSAIGEFRLFFCDVEGALNANIDSYDVFDASFRTFEYYKILMRGKEFGFAKTVNQTLNDTLSNVNVLIIDRIEIKQEYRTNGYGLDVMSALIHRFGLNAGIAAIKPFPLQFDGAMPQVEVAGITAEDVKKWTTALAKATKKLVSYYEKIDFQRLPGSPYMVRSL
jgi:hypothetical protein